MRGRSERSNLRRLFLRKSSWRLGDAKAVAWGDLTTAAESLHQLGGLNAAGNSDLEGDMRDARADEVNKPPSLRDLVLNHGFDVLFLLLSAVLPLNVFRWAAAEVVCPVFLRDDVSTPVPYTANSGGKSPNFCFYIRPLNSVCPGLQLVSLLLECGNIGIGRERSQDVVGDVNRGTGIAHETHMGQHAKNAVGRRAFEDRGLDVEPHTLIDAERRRWQYLDTTNVCVSERCLRVELPRTNLRSTTLAVPRRKQ
jgi:hypothetical protein